MGLSIREAYEILGQRVARVSTLQEITGQTPAEIADEIETLLTVDTTFRAEPEPFGHRVTAQDKRYAPVIGGEARHLITWN